MHDSRSGLAGLVLGGTLAACAPKTTGGDDTTGTGSGGDAMLPEGCEDLFDHGEFDCNETAPGICDFLESTPDQLAYWGIVFEEDLADDGQSPAENVSDFERKAQCVSDYLDAVGVEHQPIENDLFVVKASYDQVEPLCRASMIEGCEPGSVPDDCTPLDEAQCGEIPLCKSIRGWRIEDGADCHERDVFAGCLGFDVGCDDGSSPTRGPDGACWSGVACFNGDPGWTWDDTCPDFDEWETIPECG